MYTFVKIQQMHIAILHFIAYKFDLKIKNILDNIEL